MALLDFTSFDDIRAALGVSSEEIEDSALSLPLYEFNLVAEMEDVDDGLIAAYTAAKDVAEGSRTAAQRRLVQSTFMFATYAVAKQLTSTLPMFSPKEIGDGKAHMTRFLDPYKATIARVEQEFEKARTRVIEALAVVQSSSVVTPAPRVFIAISSPSTDPVTG